jgi:DNA-binding XRE family transcriptional regulator
MRHKFDCQLRRVRRTWGLSQKELAYVLELTRQHVSAIERAKRAPSRAVLIACQVVFGEHLRELFPKLWNDAEEAVVRSLYALKLRLSKESSAVAARKEQFVDAALQRAVTSV